jgi:hypothetical protein
MIIPRRDVCSFSHAGRLEPAERIVNPPSAPLYWLNRRLREAAHDFRCPRLKTGLPPPIECSTERTAMFTGSDRPKPPLIRSSCASSVAIQQQRRGRGCRCLAASPRSEPPANVTAIQQLSSAQTRCADLLNANGVRMGVAATMAACFLALVGMGIPIWHTSRP